jgi:hypothetical protein
VSEEAEDEEGEKSLKGGYDLIYSHPEEIFSMP